MALSLPHNIKIILAGTALINAAYWMTWPFLAIMLHRQYQLSSSQIGAILSLSIVFSTIVGLYLGNVADKIGRNVVMIAGCSVAIVAYGWLAFVSNIKLFLLAILMVSLARAVLDPMCKAIFGDLVESAEDRSTALQLRYFAVNLGAAIGPLLGVYAGIAAKQETFLITAIAYFIYAILLVKIFFAKNSSASKQIKSQLSLLETLNLLKMDHAFLALVMVNILLWIIFVQFESSIAIYFSLLNLPKLITLLSFIIFTNTLSVVILQLPLLHWLRKLTVTTKIYLSIALLALSQLAFAYSAPENFTAWIVATVIFSVAEAILVPSLNIQIDQMAPNHLRGSYFSVSFLYRIGCGAYIGGALLQSIGAKGLFVTMFFIAIIAAVLYSISARLKRLG